VTEPTAIERARRWLADEIMAAQAAGIDGRLAALGWATVDLERAAGEFEADPSLRAAASSLTADPRFAAAQGTSLLGARCLVARELLPDGVSLALLEPDTEGRLAATLARHGEGPAALWLSVPDLDAAATAMHRAGIATSASRPGPFGPERLVLGGAIAGPHRLAVQLAGTIRA
jgi:hypothetical protein